MTIAEAIKQTIWLNADDAKVDMVCVKRGLSPDGEFNSETDRKVFDLCTADMAILALTAPNVSEGGVSISMPNRDNLLAFANSIYSKYGEGTVDTAGTPTVKRIDL